MKTKNSSKIKSILGISLGALVAFSCLPATNFAKLVKLNSKAEVTSTFTNTGVDITNGDFQTGVNGQRETVNGWSTDYASIISEDKTAGRTSATTISGWVDTSTDSNFSTTYIQLLSDCWYTKSLKDSNLALYNAITNAIATTNNVTTIEQLGGAFAVPTNPTKFLYYENEKDSNYTVLNDLTIKDASEETDNKRSIEYNSKVFVESNSTTDIGALRTFTYTNTSDESKVEKIVVGSNVLMLSAGNLLDVPEDSNPFDVNGTPRKVHYKYTSNKITLTTYTYYKLKVLVKTTGGAKASIALTGDLKENEKSSITQIATTDDKWEERTFYIATGYGTAGNYSFQIDLGIGDKDNLSTGTVYFDNVSLEKIQYSEFLRAEEQAKTDSKVNIINERDIVRVTDFEKNSNDQTLTTLEEANWSIVPRDGGVEPEYSQIINEYNHSKNSTFTSSTTNNNVLLVENTDSKNSLQLTTNKFQVEPLKYYRITLWSRTNYNYSNKADAHFNLKLNGTLNGKTVSANEFKVTPYQSASTNAEPSHENNLWISSSCYIQACPLYATDVWFTITIPASSSFLFDQYTIEEVTSNEYTATANTKLTLTTSLPSETDKITNGHFYTVESENTPSGLYTPKDWDLAISTTTTKDIYTFFEDPTSTTYTSVLTASDFTDLQADSIVYNSKTYARKESTNTFEYKEGEPGSEAVVSKIVLNENVKFTYDASEKKLVNTSYPEHKVEITDFTYGLTLGKDYDNTKTHTTSDKNVVNPSSFPENYLVVNNYNDGTNKINNKLTYTSAKFSVASGAVKEIKVSVFNELTAGTAKLNLLNSSGEVVATTKIIAGETEWKEYKFYVLGGTSSANLNLQLEYGDTSDGATITKGAVMLKVATITTSTKNKFAEMQKLSLVDASRAYINVLNLAGNGFSELGKEIEENKYEVLNFNKATASTGSAYILHTHSTDSDYETNFKDQFGAYVNTDSNSPYVLVLKNTDGQSTTVTSKQKHSLAKKSFYKITVNAKAIGLPTGVSGTIKFTNITETFDVSQTEFTTYTLLFATNDKDDVTSQIQFELLNSVGELVIDSYNIESMTESNFKTALDAIEEGSTTIKAVDLRTASTSNSDEEVPDIEDENNTLEILFATLSSLLLVLALIFALVITRVNIKRGKIKKSGGKSNYKPTDDDGNEQKGFI